MDSQNYKKLRTEKILVKMLILCSTAGSQAEATSFLVFSRYSQLITADRSIKWKYVDVFLTICDKITVQLYEQGQAGYEALEKWLVALISLASDFDKPQESFFLQNLLTVFLKQGKFSEIGKCGLVLFVTNDTDVFPADQYLATSNGNLAGGMQKILCLKEIRSGDIQTAALKLSESLASGYFLQAEEVESALKSFLPKLLGEAKERRETAGELLQLLQVLAEQKFYFSLGVFRLSLQLASRLGEAQLNRLARRLYEDSSLGWHSGLDTQSSLAGLCWNLAAGASSPLTKHFLLLLSAHLLPWTDQARDQLLLTSLTVGLQALIGADWSDSRKIRSKLEDTVRLLEANEVNTETRRFLSLVKFRLAQASERECGWDPCVLLSDVIKTNDQVGLLALSRMAWEDPRYLDVNLTALSEALKLEKSVATNREVLAVANLELIARVPTSSKFWSITSQVNTVIWTERSLLTEALKLAWNIWVTVTNNSESKEICTAWFETMAGLHNKATESCDHISCRQDKPTSGRIYSICFQSFYQHSCQVSSRKSRGFSSIFQRTDDRNDTRVIIDLNKVM